MPIALREDVAYILLKKINEGGQGMHEVNITDTDIAGRGLSVTDLLGHLDYLNQKQFIKAEFTGNAYATEQDVPNAQTQEVDFRIASPIDPSDPLPHLITFKSAELTEKGRKLLEKMEANPPQALDEGPAVPIATKDMPFLEKVMVKGELEDIFDARDITEVVYRVMRDLMTTEAADRVADELHTEVLDTEDKALQMEITDLWKDTNPIVGFISRLRPPFHGIFEIDSDRFLFRVANESGMPQVNRERVVEAVFSATKDELSEELIQEIASWLPDHVRELWEKA